MSLLLLILGLIMFVGLVVLHELGHAIAAKRSGVVVEEFGVGFPPRAWVKKLKNGTHFSVNWLPLGGFVRLKGEHDAAQGPGTYGGATLWVKTKILLAGVAVNWITAVIIFTILALVGLPKVLPNQFTVAGDSVFSGTTVKAASVMSGGPADKAGIATGDTISDFAGQKITSADDFKALTQSHAGQKTAITYQHNGQNKQADVVLNKDNAGGKGFIGVGAADSTVPTQRATWSAPIVGVGVTAQFTYETLKGLVGIFANLFSAHFADAGAGVTGPVGIFGVLQSSADAGFVPVLFLIGIISLTLAVMNILPIPALDGGRLFVTLLFRALKKPLTKEREESIQAAGMTALLGLMALITILDVKRFF